MIEGRTARDISRAKQMLHGTQPASGASAARSESRGPTAEYLKMQVAAGASVIQLFDTWAGNSAPASTTPSNCLQRSRSSKRSAARRLLLP